MNHIRHDSIQDTSGKLSSQLHRRKVTSKTSNYLSSYTNQRETVNLQFDRAEFDSEHLKTQSALSPKSGNDRKSPQNHTKILARNRTKSLI